VLISAVARDEVTPTAHVAPIQISDAIIRQAGPQPDGLCTCFVAQKLPRQIQAGAFAVIAVVGYSHDTSCVRAGINYTSGKIFPKRNFGKLPFFGKRSDGHRGYECLIVSECSRQFRSLFGAAEGG